LTLGERSCLATAWESRAVGSGKLVSHQLAEACTTARLVRQRCPGQAGRAQMVTVVIGESGKIVELEHEAWNVSVRLKELERLGECLPGAFDVTQGVR